MSENFPDTHHDSYSKTVFGFWLYLLTDFVLFATILSVYFVLRGSTCGGVGAKDLLPLSYTLIQTILLLCSSLTSGFAGVATHARRKKEALVWFILTFLLGISFLWMEMSGMASLVGSGNSWAKSAFLSAYFTLVGTHALHVLFALLWTVVLVPLMFLRKITIATLQRLTSLRLFWQFLNMIWIGIFIIVYLMELS